MNIKPTSIVVLMPMRLVFCICTLIYPSTLFVSETTLCFVRIEPPLKQQVRAYATKRNSIFAPSFDIDTIAPGADAPKLSHPSKDRPKLRKNYLVKRPVIACESLLMEDADAEEVARYLGSQMIGSGEADSTRRSSAFDLRSFTVTVHVSVEFNGLLVYVLVVLYERFIPLSDSL